MTSCVAAIDIGTNTVRLLIQSLAGALVARDLAITRLGEGVDAQGLLAEAAMERTVGALQRFRGALDAHKPLRVRMVATSAARDAKNRDEFFARVHAAVGHTPELLSGDTEARLSFAGASLGQANPGNPKVVIDIGGGSTELAFGRQEVEAALSLNVGSVRLAERHLHSDPPTAAELATAQQTLRTELNKAHAFNTLPLTTEWVGVAGTVTTLAAFAAGLQNYTPAITHGMQLSRCALEDAFRTLAALPLTARRPLLIEPKRAEAIVGGAAVLHTVFEHFNLTQMTVSETDILDGLVQSLMPGA